jgi:hypothetical protein
MTDILTNPVFWTGLGVGFVVGAALSFILSMRAYYNAFKSPRR